MLQTQAPATASRSRHQGWATTKDWEPTTQPCSRTLQLGGSVEAGRLTPAPQP